MRDVSLSYTTEYTFTDVPDDVTDADLRSGLEAFLSMREGDTDDVWMEDRGLDDEHIIVETCASWEAQGGDLAACEESLAIAHAEIHRLQAELDKLDPEINLTWVAVNVEDLGLKISHLVSEGVDVNAADVRPSPSEPGRFLITFICKASLAAANNWAR